MADHRLSLEDAITIIKNAERPTVPDGSYASLRLHLAVAQLAIINATPLSKVPDSLGMRLDQMREYKESLMQESFYDQLLLPSEQTRLPGAMAVVNMIAEHIRSATTNSGRIG